MKASPPNFLTLTASDGVLVWSPHSDPCSSAPPLPGLDFEVQPAVCLLPEPHVFEWGVRWGAGGGTRVPLPLYKLCTHRTQLQETPPSVGERSIDLLTSLFTDLFGVSTYVQVLRAQGWKDCRHPHGQRRVWLTYRGRSMSSTVLGTW